MSEFSIVPYNICEYVYMFAVFLYADAFLMFCFIIHSANAPRINSYFSSHTLYAAAAHIEQTSYLCCGCLFFILLLLSSSVALSLLSVFFFFSYAETKKKIRKMTSIFCALRIKHSVADETSGKCWHDGYVGYGKSP